MLTYPGDPRGYPPQHVYLSSLSTSAGPFTVDGPHPADPAFPNPSLDVPAVPSLNAAGGWGDASLMETSARFMAPDAVTAASLGYTGDVFDSAPYGIYSGNHFSNFVDPHPLRSESSELISEKRPGTCLENSEALSYGFGLSAHCQQQNASAMKLLDDIAAESAGCYYLRHVPNQGPSGSATSLIGGAPAVPVKTLTSGSVLGNISSQAAEAEKNAHNQILTKEGEEHSHCHPDAEGNMLQMSDASSRNQAIFLELMHNLSVVLLSTCNGGSSLQEYEKENLKSVIQNLEAVSSKGGKATLKGDDRLRNSSQMSCVRNNFSVAIPEHSVSKNTDSEFNTYFSQALPKFPKDKMLDDSEVSQVSIYKELWIEAEVSVCKLKYELQIARMKLATNKGHNKTETVPINPSEGDNASRLPASGGKPHSHAKENSMCAATLQCHRGDSGGSQSPVVNRVSTQQSSCVLASSAVSQPPAVVPQPYLAATDTPSGPHSDYNLGFTPQQCYKESDLGHNNVCGSYQSGPCQSSSTKQELLTRHLHHNALAHGPDARSSGPAPPPPPSDILSPRSITATHKSIVNGVDAERLARLEVIESRIDNVSSLGENKCEEQQEASKESPAVEDGVLAGLRIVKPCADNITSLSLESIKHQLDTNTNTTDEVDDAVDEMFTRLKVLESRIDTLSSLGENKYVEQQRESEGSYAVDDAVLARLRILKSRADNITSLGLQSSKQQRDASTNTSGEIDDAGAEMCTRLEVLEPCIENASSLGDNKCEEQQKESKGSYSIGDGVLARLQVLKSRADTIIISLGLESSKQQLNASTDIADEVDDAVMARLGILKSRPDLEACSIGGDVEGVEEDPSTVGLQVSSRQPPPSPAAVLEKITLSSAAEPLEVTGETPAILILPSTGVPPLSMLKDAPSVLEKDHSGLADDALPPAPLSSVPQEVGGLARKIAKVKRLSHGPMPRSFRLPSTIKIKRPISEQGARAILLRKLGMIKDDEVDEQAMDRCLEALEASFPKSLLQAIFCGTNMAKGTPGELWGISASDVVF